MPTDLLGQIHSSTATTSPDWATFRGEVTGMYLLSGQGGEWDSQHLIREYNRNINSLYKSWTPTEPNATGLFIEPYNAGFSYQGTGDFRDYKWDTYSLAFDGVDDYVDLGSIALGTVHTVSVWHKLGSLSSNPYIFGSTYGYALNLYGVGKTMYYRPDSGGGVLMSYTFEEGWHHYAISRDDRDVSFYVDGVKVGSTQTLAGNVAFTLKYFMSYNTVYFGNGETDEVAVWDSALSAAQILAIYNGGTPESLAPYSPVSWWRMGDGPLDDGNVAGNGLIGDQVNPTLGSELVLNGDMELDDNWNDIGSPTTNERSTEQVYSGTYSRKCVANAGSEGLKSDTFSLVAGTVYKVSFYYYLEIAAGPTYRWIMKLKDGDGSDLDPSHNLTVTGAWTNITFYTTATATGSSSSFQVFQSLGGDSTLYLDNVSVKQVNGNAGIMENMTASDIVADTP